MVTRKTNKIINNFAGGMVSPLLHGRQDLPLYNKAARLVQNFFVLPQGGGRYRNGTTFVRYTRLNKKAWFIPFQFSDQQSYLIEATEFKFRFYKDNSIITETAKTLTAMTNANPGVFTSASHGFNVGDEVYISGLAGPSGINGKFYLVGTVPTGNTFTLTDIFGNALNTTSSGAYTSGGTAARVYEITTPYMEQDIEYLQFAQSTDTMYIVHRNYAPRKLVRAGHASWNINTYSRTADPFTSTTKTITGVTQANPGVVTSAAHGLSNGALITISGIVGMTQLNGKFYIVQNVTTNTFTLTDRNGTAIDTTGYTAYSSGGSADILDKYPRAVTFTDAARILMAGTLANPTTVWGSKAPSTTTTQFDDFTTGTAATDAIIFTLAPVQGKVDVIQAMANTNKFITMLTYGTVRRLFGATEQEAISPTSINAKAVNAYGAAQILPIANGDVFFYVQRGNRVIRSLEYDISIDGYTTIDRNLVSENITKGQLRQLTEQQGAPDLIWANMYNGKLLSLTYKQKEDISGWASHYLGGSHVDSNSLTQAWGKVIAMGNMPRPSGTDQIWFVVERRINGQTVRSVEYMEDPPEYPNRLEYLTNVGTSNKDADDTIFDNVMFEKQLEACHLDMSLEYNGTSVGTAASASVTPASSAVGTGVVFTASAAVFTSAMVGREIWKKYDTNGGGGGRAVITGYTNSTTVTCRIEVAFDNTNAIPAGNWYLSARTLTGLDHLEGQTVSVTVNGGTHQDVTVASGAITLNEGVEAIRARVGYKYVGILSTLNLDIGGQIGPAATKLRNGLKMALNFLAAAGVKFGTDMYNLEPIDFRNTDQPLGRPAPPFNGYIEQGFPDGWAREKCITLLQNNPLPCTLLGIDFYGLTTDE